MAVTVVVGVGANVVARVTPAQEQALLYRAVPEQALAYEGTALGVCVAWRATRRPSSSRLWFTGGLVTVTVTVLSNSC